MDKLIVLDTTEKINKYIVDENRKKDILIYLEIYFDKSLPSTILFAYNESKKQLEYSVLIKKGNGWPIPDFKIYEYKSELN